MYYFSANTGGFDAESEYMNIVTVGTLKVG